MNCPGHIFCSRLGNALQDRDVYAAADIVLGRVGRVRSGMSSCLGSMCQARGRVL